ncbi:MULTISPECIES: ROK family protein [Vibrio]|uniref:ROK family protein n=1 Tax=Vibrio neptunius TaxID=170651 RepID=A0ABS2ZWP6_9VIBR|nr:MULTISPECIES: ROK family protein [Vibrio]MBN3492247.1 ROK family protein [Vibrio neptunius]MBN3514744.1 ROK family protein [Vibrio neptunius]MBN3552101.1 ROK family protein [Vibrio neptunius]MBN3573593.1 ROK family protein [Vibrio neptunius]MBN3576655.1 ROK family protein [Vibrio neptunius]
MLVGLDIGGTKIEGVGLDKESYATLVKHREPTNTHSYQGFLDSVLAVIKEVAQHGEIESIGIGCCGSVGNDGLMQGANVTVLNGQDFIGDLTRYIDVPVALANDADCLALSEFKDGAAKHAQHSCVAIIIGTGCGSGVVINNGLVTGLNKLGGELGHNPLPGFDKDKDGAPVQCYCGSLNCTESFVSGTGFSRSFAEKHGPADAKQIMALCAEGDTAAQQHFDLYCDQLARVCASIVNFVDPEVIVLGGGMSNVDAIYPLVNAKLNLYTFNKSAQTRIVKSVHGDSSGVRGAAFLHSLGQ